MRGRSPAFLSLYRLLLQILTARFNAVIKEVLAAIYTDFETVLDETSTGPIDQEDVFSASPLGHSLKLKFRHSV
jgi:hypothetical protein